MVGWVIVGLLLLGLAIAWYLEIKNFEIRGVHIVFPSYFFFLLGIIALLYWIDKGNVDGLIRIGLVIIAIEFVLLFIGVSLRKGEGKLGKKLREGAGGCSLIIATFLVFITLVMVGLYYLVNK